ncbi:hypothetical protein [Schumannella luteola]
MNETLIRPTHPPIVEEQPTRPVRRVGLLDRIALHVGIALIKWGRRPLPLESRERRANRVEQQLARLARERQAERSMRLLTPAR